MIVAALNASSEKFEGSAGWGRGACSVADQRGHMFPGQKIAALIALNTRSLQDRSDLRPDPTG